MASAVQQSSPSQQKYFQLQFLILKFEFGSGKVIILTGSRTLGIALCCKRLPAPRVRKQIRIRRKLGTVSRGV
jgi:hypothetical protein